MTPRFQELIEQAIRECKPDDNPGEDHVQAEVRMTYMEYLRNVLESNYRFELADRITLDAMGRNFRERFPGDYQLAMTFDERTNAVNIGMLFDDIYAEVEWKLRNG